MQDDAQGSESERNQLGERSYACPICGQATTFAGQLPPLYPFCSSRCKMVDLGRWFLGQYSIDREMAPDDPIAGPPPGGSGE